MRRIVILLLAGLMCACTAAEAPETQKPKKRGPVRLLPHSKRAVPPIQYIPAPLARPMTMPLECRIQFSIATPPPKRSEEEIQRAMKKAVERMQNANKSRSMQFDRQNLPTPTEQ